METQLAMSSAPPLPPAPTDFLDAQPITKLTQNIRPHLKEVTDIKFTRHCTISGMSHGSLCSTRIWLGTTVGYVLYQFYECNIPDPAKVGRRISSKHCVVFGIKSGPMYHKENPADLAFMVKPLDQKQRTIARALITSRHNLLDTLKEMNAERDKDDSPIMWFPFLFW